MFSSLNSVSVVVVASGFRVRKGVYRLYTRKRNDVILTLGHRFRTIKNLSPHLVWTPEHKSLVMPPTDGCDLNDDGETDYPRFGQVTLSVEDSPQPVVWSRRRANRGCSPHRASSILLHLGKRETEKMLDFSYKRVIHLFNVMFRSVGVESQRDRNVKCNKLNRLIELRVCKPPLSAGLSPGVS